MDNQVQEIDEPFKEREKKIDALTEWLKEECPSTLALIRYPAAGEETPGIFVPLGETKLFALEAPAGERDGFEYWRRGHNWRIQLRWAGMRWAYNYLTRREDDTGFREALTEGIILFDKTDAVKSLRATAEVSMQFRHFASRELFHYRVELDDLINELNALEADTVEITKNTAWALMEKYERFAQIVTALPSGEEALLNISHRIIHAGESKRHFTVACRELTSLIKRASEKLGGKPDNEWFAPAQQAHLMPPGAMETESEEEIIACRRCMRKFIANPEEPTHPGEEYIQVGEPSPEPLWDPNPEGSHVCTCEDDEEPCSDEDCICSD